MAANLSIFLRILEQSAKGLHFPGGVHNMLGVRVCAAHMGGFLDPKFSKQGSFFHKIFPKHWSVFQILVKSGQKWVVFR